MRRASCCRAYSPKVSAATAGPKTSPAIAIRLLAIATGQKLGHAKMMTAPTRQHGKRQDDRPALGAGLVDRGTDRRLHGKPEQPPERRHQPDLGLAPVLLGDQEHVEIRPERAAHVGQQEIDRVERERRDTLAFGRRPHSHSHSVPIARVMRVSGAPTRK